MEVDLRRLEDCARAMGSPHSVLAYVGNPPSTGTKLTGGDAIRGETLEALSGPAELGGGDMTEVAAGAPVDRCSLTVDDDAPVDPERPLSL